MECLIDNGPFGKDITSSLGDDNYVSIIFPVSFTFPFYGIDYSSVYINANGYLTFINGDSTIYPSFSEFKSGDPRIAPFWTDLNPRLSPVGVFYKQLSDRFVVTWIQVPFYGYYGVGNPTYNTFQVVLYDTGRVGFAYNDLDNTTLTTHARNVLVGVAEGNYGNSCIFRYNPPANYDPQQTVVGPTEELDGKQLFFGFSEEGCTLSVRGCPSRGVLFEIV